jgi:hypothetical protein
MRPRLTAAEVHDLAAIELGVITRWENFDTQTYRRAFTAHVTTT